MNLIPESNGLHRIRMKSKLTLMQWVKRISIVLLIVIGSGFVFQIISNFIGNEKVSQRLNYAKIDNKRMEYKVSGSGDYTVVFDGAIGTNLYAWNDVCKKVEKSLGVKTFVYNRNGYGFNDIGEKKSTNDQAEDLRVLIRKAGVSGKLILVGEEYGSLVITDFAEKYPELVAGVVLIKPLSEENLKSSEFKKSIRGKYYRSKIESLGTSFGLTTILEKLGLTYSVDGFEENLPKGADEEFSVHKTKKNYRQAVSNELEALYKYQGDYQKENMLSNVPLYIISNDENDPISKIGDKELTTIYTTESNKGIISSTDSDAISNALSLVFKEVKKIEKRMNK